MKRALWFVLALTGCQSLIDLEERHLVDGSEDLHPTVAECTSYCDRMLGTGSQAARCGSVYSSPEACKQSCLTFTRGTPGDDPLDPTDGKRNTLACREAYAARVTPMAADAEALCTNAGPGGNNACGSNCESYCNLFATACPTEWSEQQLDLASCTKKCGALRDKPGLNAADGADHEGDTVQCRLVHASNSAAYHATNPSLANPHCGHASIRSTEYCVDEPTSATYCQSYCTLVATACQGTQQLYENTDQCLKTCAALDKGTAVKDSTGNTMTCRVYHGYNALVTSDSHCGHAGPGGWDVAHCGDECTSYCKLARTACGEAFAAKYPGSDPEAACRTSCQPLVAIEPAGYQGYTLAAGKSAGGLPGKLYATLKALETGDPNFCTQALAD